MLEIPEPQSGIDDVFDNANDKVTQIKEELERYLEENVRRGMFGIYPQKKGQLS